MLVDEAAYRVLGFVRGGLTPAALCQSLSHREHEVLELLANGLTNRQIAKRLAVSRRTVDHHVGHILRKLDATNRTVAVLAAERLGMLSAGLSDI